MASLKKYIRNIKKNQHLLTSSHYFQISETLINSKDEKLSRETFKILAGPNDSIGKITCSLILNKSTATKAQITQLSQQILTTYADKLEYTRFRLLSRTLVLSDLVSNLNDTMNDLNAMNWDPRLQRTTEILIIEIFTLAQKEEYILFQELSKLLLPYLFINQDEFKKSIYNIYSSKKLEYLVKNYANMDKNTLEGSALLQVNERDDESLNNKIKLALLLKDAGKMDLNAVVELFNSYLRTGFLPDRDIFNLLIQEVGNGNVQCLPTENTPASQEPEIDPQVKCWEIFRSMERSGIPSTSESFALLFSSCKNPKNKDKSFIFKIEEYLVSNNKTHSYQSLYSLIESLLVLGHYQQAFQRILDMESSNIPLNKDIYRMVLQISTTDKRLALHAIKEFKRDTSDNYDLLLECCRVSGDYVSALELVDEMHERKVDLKPYRNLVMELGELGGSEFLDALVGYYKK
ncbi:hypothetical protein HDV01_004051 [Terramyces sp. JEL0728]|nr:hypothetical protein HDV01_004051 [Terramyces sp. JEL0728]